MPHFEAHMVKYLKDIKDICVSIENKKGGFNPWSFVQKWSGKNKHPRAILDTLNLLCVNWGTIKNPWPYANTVVGILSGNYCEVEHIKESEEFKKMCDSAPLKKLAKDLFESI